MPGPSLISRGASTFEAITKRSRPKININLVNDAAGFVTSYTTFDKIQGEVTVEVEQSTAFHSIEIAFDGISRTSVDRPTTAAHATSQPAAFHTFLKLRQPIPESAYPEDRAFKPGEPFRLPFTFVVPERLLPQACSHSVSSVHIREAHTQLPPSLGDPIVSSDGTALLDDLAPQMSQISYMIRVTITKPPLVAGAKLRTLAAVARKIRIIPSSAEDPPLDVEDNSEDYCLRREKDVRRGLFRSKIGRLVVACSQPKALELPPPGSDLDAPVTSSVTLHLRFDPGADDEHPPRLGSLVKKLKCSTYYGTLPWSQYPNRTNTIGWYTLRGVYAENVSLSSMCVASAQWERHENEDDTERRGSVQSTASALSQVEPTLTYNGSAFYTASIIVPLALPKSKAFLPTFHSCLISRVYTLELSLSYHTPKSNVVSPSVSLKTPIQIKSAFRENAFENLLNVEFTQTQVEDEFFRPRSIAPPIPGYNDSSTSRGSSLVLGTSFDPAYHDDDDALPDYSSLLPGARIRPRCLNENGNDDNNNDNDGDDDDD